MALKGSKGEDDLLKRMLLIVCSCQVLYLSLIFFHAHALMEGYGVVPYRTGDDHSGSASLLRTRDGSADPGVGYQAGLNSFGTRVVRDEEEETGLSLPPIGQGGSGQVQKVRRHYE